MAQQTINIGTSPNDDTGDDIRSGGDKINDNFTEVYADIATNIGNIGTNATNIGTNATNIATNTSEIALRRLLTDSFSRAEVNERSLGNLPRNGLTFKAAQDERVSITDNDIFSFGDGSVDSPFGAIITMRMVEATSAPLVAKFETGQEEWAFQVNASDFLVLEIRDQSAGVSSVRTSDVALTAVEGQVVQVGFSYDGSGGASAANGIKLYLNGGIMASTATNNASYVAMENLTSALNIGRLTAASPHFEGEVFSLTVYNRLLSDAEFLDLAETGGRTQYADQVLADSNNVYNSDFSAGDDSWTATRLTVDGNIDSIGGLDDNLRGTLTGGSDTHFLINSGVAMPSLQAGKNYRLSYSYFIPSGNSACDGVRLKTASNDVVAGFINGTVTDTWTDVTADVLWIDAADNFRFHATDGGATAVNGDGDVFYIRAVRVKEIGSVLESDFEQGVGGQLPDRSANGHHGFIDGPRFLILKNRGVLRYSTNNSGNQQIIGNDVIPINARITGWTINSAGTPTIDLGNVSAGTQFDSATVLTAGRQQISLDTEFSSTGELWVNSGTTDVLQHTIYFEIVD